jgi:meso-butanediol dehydrogenase / (S,S)-butanediol dehydrogenase / diacetyl reductase
MPHRLTDKVVVITGTGDGIGRAAALLFAAEGAKVVGCDLNTEKLTETQRLVEAAGGEMTAVTVDLSDEDEVERLMDVTTRTYGGLDAVFHTATGMRLGTPENFSAEDMDFNLSKVATMSFIVAKSAIARMRERGGGSVILCGSMSGLNYGSGFTGNTAHIFAYAAAKAAVTRLGIGQLHDMNLGHLAIRRLGRPEDVAWAALFLASDESTWVTGTVFPVDGGFTATGGLGGPTDRAVTLIDDILATAGEH